MTARFKAFATWAKRIHTALDSLLYGTNRDYQELPDVLTLRLGLPKRMCEAR